MTLHITIVFIFSTSFFKSQILKTATISHKCNCISQNCSYHSCNLFFCNCYFISRSLLNIFIIVTLFLISHLFYYCDYILQLQLYIYHNLILFCILNFIWYYFFFFYTCSLIIWKTQSMCCEFPTRNACIRSHDMRLFVVNVMLVFVGRGSWSCNVF